MPKNRTSKQAVRASGTPMKSLLAVLLLTSAAAFAADRPNLAGDWKVNFDKSDYGVIPAPSSFTRKITHAEPSITFEDLQETAIGPDRTERKYTTDGKEIKFDAQGAEVKSAVTWSADGKLVVKTKVEVISLDITETITPGADGKTLESSVHIVSPQGAVDVKILFVKQ